jgi:hypothetical protein
MDLVMSDVDMNDNALKECGYCRCLFQNVKVPSEQIRDDVFYTAWLVREPTRKKGR